MRRFMFLSLCLLFGISLLAVFSVSDVYARLAASPGPSLIDDLRATDITTTQIDSRHYALVASSYGDSIRIIDITNPSSPSPVANIADGDDYLLGGASGITTTQIGSNHYALVAATHDNGVQIIDITNPSSPSPVANITDSRRGDYQELAGARGITTTQIDSRHYALVASTNDDGIQIIDITNPSSPSPVAAITDRNDYQELNGAWGITTTQIGTRHYALVASYYDNGVQIIDITNPSSPSPVAAITDSRHSYPALNGAQGITTTQIGTRHYALVASFRDDGVQIIDITNPSSPSPVAAITDGADYPNLNGAWSITTTQIGTRHYALVASYYDGAQVILLTDTAPPTFSSATLDESTGEVTITFSESIDQSPASSVNLARIFISETGQTDQTALSGATYTGGVDGATVTLTLTSSQLTAVRGYATPQLDISEGAVRDISGNDIAASADNTITVSNPYTPYAYPQTAYTTVWSATLTQPDASLMGCDNDSVGSECSSPNVLTDDSFTVAGVAYEVAALTTADNTLTFKLNTGMSKIFRSVLTLYVDDTSFPLTNANYTFGSLGSCWWRDRNCDLANHDANMTASWNSVGLSWNVNDTVQISLVRAADVTAPIIELAGPSHVTISLNSAYIEPGYTSTDNYDGDLTGSVTVTGTIDVTKEGTYTLYYDVSDSSGNAAVQQVRTVSVSGIWSATLSPYGATGCWSDNSVMGCVVRLSPNTFTYDGETYKVNMVVLTTKKVLTLRLDNTIPGAHNATLVVDGMSFGFDASTTSRPMWYDTGLDWSAISTVQISLQVNQGQEETPNQELVSINDVPTGANKAITIQEDATHTFAASDFGFSDSDTGDSLAKVQITELQSAGSLKLGGTQVTLNQEVAASDIPTLVFEPVSGASGSPYATFQFKVSDGVSYSSGANTITINVTPTNDVPVGTDETNTDQDVTAPVIALVGSSHINIPLNSAYTELGYTATDDYDGDLTGNVTVTGTVDTTRIGTYSMYYDVTDSSGNAAIQQVRSVTVEDVTAPVIQLVGPSYMNVPLNAPRAEPGYTDTDDYVFQFNGHDFYSVYAEPGYTATDDYDGDLTGSVIITGAVDIAREGTYYLYYDVTDSSGNAAIQQVRSVTVEDVSEPEPEPEPADLIERYDTDGNGSIDQQEWMKAVKDRTDGLLTSYEIWLISTARSYN